MSTPRPSEEDVEALTRMVPYEDGTGGWLFRTATTSEVHARLVDWLAARGAEHEREVAALRERKETYHEQWMLTERALADLRGEIKALDDEWSAVPVDEDPWAYEKSQALRALFPRDDAAGAGGAE